MSQLCGECGVKIGLLSGSFQQEGVAYCKACAPDVQARVRRRAEVIKRGVDHIFVATIDSPNQFDASKTLGVVSSRVALKLDILEDLFVNAMDNWGGSSGLVQRRFKRAETQAIQEIRVEAAILGAIGVVGLRVNYDFVEMKRGKWVLVNLLGTAVGHIK